MAEKHEAFAAWRQYKDGKEKEDKMGLRIKKFLADGTSQKLALNFKDQQVNKATEKLLNDEIQDRFKLNRMNQEFQADLMANSRKIFNELTAEERAEEERKKAEERQR